MINRHKDKSRFATIFLEKKKSCLYKSFRWGKFKATKAPDSFCQALSLSLLSLSLLIYTQKK